jgi:homoserine kinase
VKLTISTPATTANFGAGFDVFGAALSCENRFFVEVGGEGFALADGSRLPVEGRNLFLAALESAAAALGASTPGVGVLADAAVPLRSGLGSSATAICAGLLAAQAILGKDLPPGDLLRLASLLDGHPDNVAACLLGGVTISAGGGLVRRLPAPGMAAIVFYPGTEQGTEAARRGLTAQVERQDAVFNIARASLFVYALTQGDHDLLRVACEDRLHETVRLRALPYAEQARTAALDAGAYAMPLSGSGPSMIALTSHERAQAVTTALREVAADHPPARVIPLSFSDRGARVASDS